MTYIELSGIPHYYEWIGADGATTPSGVRPVMVFVHGWGSSGRYWRSTARALADIYDCLLYDLRGFGRSSARAQSMPLPFADPRDEAYALERYAEELLTLLNNLNLARVSIQAHSMGSSIAALLLSKAPDRVERAVFACGGVFDYNPVTFGLFQKIGGFVVQMRPDWIARIPGMDRMTIARFVHKMPNRPIRQEFLEDYMLADITAGLGTMYTSVSKHASIAQPAAFAKIQCPTLIVSGEKDIIIPSELGQKAAALNEKISHAEISNVAHLPMLEASEAYLAIVRDFLLS
ncbi:MAG: alpha/beta fold hydrolase [Synechococcus sp.]